MRWWGTLLSRLVSHPQSTSHSPDLPFLKGERAVPTWPTPGSRQHGGSQGWRCPEDRRHTQRGTGWPPWACTWGLSPSWVGALVTSPPEAETVGSHMLLKTCAIPHKCSQQQLVTTAKMWKNLQVHRPMGECVQRGWSIHPVDYDSATKRNEAPTQLQHGRTLKARCCVRDARHRRARSI